MFLGLDIRVINTPLYPTCIIVKLGFSGVNLFSVFLIKNINCMYSLEPPRLGDSNTARPV